VPVEAMVQLSDVEFRYPVGGFALRIPMLEVARGESVAVIGPSGSGKTTLLQLIAGISLPASGTVTTNGTPVNLLDDAARREFRIRNLGLVFQEFELLEYLSVLDNVLLPYRIHPGLTLDSDVRSRALALAECVGVSNKLDRKARKLSQGEKQRAAVCRALIAEPKLLLADEPTGNLDPDNKQRVLDILFEQASDSHSTLIVVTHDRDLLDRFARVIDVKEFHAERVKS
jgi:putative ABC transport system ATP-binding protein